MIQILASTEQLLQELLGWLQREQAQLGEGFYCNKDIIVASHAVGELHCSIANGQVVGFVVHTASSARASIDILEVHPEHRRRGIGTQLATYTLRLLRASPAQFITVQCRPRSSELFWRALGFSPHASFSPSSREAIRLAIRNVA